MPNATLINSIQINTVDTDPSATSGAMATDDKFTTGAASNCFWMMELSATMHVKVVTMLGDYAT